jgi:branched-chain amino acid transport system ATP-binding protein
VTGIYRPQTGEVELGGRPLTGLPAHHRLRAGVARTFQTCLIWRRMTVLDNVLVGMHDRSGTGLARAALVPAPLRTDERRLVADAWDLLHLVGLDSRGRDLAGSLSTVDQRRLEIARALASRPSLLILDEPAAGMHPADVATLIELIRAVRDAGVTVLLIEHHMDVVLDVADRVTVLDFGRVIADGAPAEVVADAAVIRAYLGSDEPPTPLAAAPSSEPGPEPVLSVRELTVTYGDAPALTSVDLEVRAGEVVALVGANGAGKTTALRAISGLPELLMAVRGEVVFAGERIGGRSAAAIARRGLIHVPEGRRVFPESTVEENLLLGAHRRRDRDRIGADLLEVYRRFEALERRRTQQAGLLSGGEQQMLALGRALMAAPSFLLLDEPSWGLAPNLAAQVFQDVRAFADEGIPVLIVEQRATGALGIADRAYVLANGRVVAEGTAADVASSPAVREAYLGAQRAVGDAGGDAPAGAIRDEGDSSRSGTASS